MKSTSEDLLRRFHFGNVTGDERFQIENRLLESAQILEAYFSIKREEERVGWEWQLPVSLQQQLQRAIAAPRDLKIRPKSLGIPLLATAALLVMVLWHIGHRETSKTLSPAVENIPASMSVDSATDRPLNVQYL